MDSNPIANATDKQVAKALDANATLLEMQARKLQAWRIERLAALARREGGNSALGRKLNYRDGAYIGQMLRGERPITEKLVLAVHNLPGYSGWFDMPAENRQPNEIDLDSNPDFPSIKRVRFKLSAGASGFAVECLDDESEPLFVFPREWYQKRGLRPDLLFSTRVINGSMETGLYDGDYVLINTQSNQPKDGVVFAVNYEGEMVIKRLVYDEGKWWLSSDNQDKARYPRKACHENVFLIGEVIAKHSERI